MVRYEKVEPLIKKVRAEIFRLARQAPDLETMHWYMWLDANFENDEFHPSDFGKVQWQSQVLNEKKEPIGRLFYLMTSVLRKMGCVDAEGKPILNKN